tara:strand:- start:2497 stop:3405 length:909 start_codon:yes stop_codon:yes gene_type:complete
MSNKYLEFSEFKEKFTLRIQNNLEDIFNSYGKSSFGLIEPMRYSTLNGSKFIRSLLVYSTGAALKISPKLLDQVAIAIELIHTYTLIHDDLPCMDDDDVRRGSPSCHVAFSESSAILAGDALQSLAFEVLSKKMDNDISPEISLNWVNYLASSIGLRGVAGGQYLDLLINGKNVQIDRLEKIYDLKTAHLIKPCIMLPLMISRFSKDKNTYENFQKFGTLLGISFQIKDDLLGYTSSSEVLGKTKNKDEIRNQPNFVNILGVEETKNILKENKESMRKILINNNFKNSYLTDITNYIFERKF